MHLLTSISHLFHFHLYFHFRSLFPVTIQKHRLGVSSCFFFSFVHCFIMQSCSHHIKKTCFVHNPSLSLSMHNISAQLWWKYQSSSTFKWWCQMLESFVRFKLYCISWFSFYNLYIRSLQFSPYGRRESMEYAAGPVILQWLTTRLVKFNVFQTIIPYFKVNDQTFTKLIFHSKKYHLLNEKNNY